MNINIPPLTKLPIDDCLDDLKSALQNNSSAILVAPPGAGKTTRVPIALLNEPWMKAGMKTGNKAGKIIMLEPRRIAARSAAHFMASLLGEKVGQTIGYRVRMDSKTSSQTRIEVVTEGVFTRMILDDPELNGVAAVLFDEYHERSLDADLGLALALDVQEVFRPNLRIMPMSATMDGSRVSQLFQNQKQVVPIIVSEGRAFPIEIRYENKTPNERTEEAMLRVIRKAHNEETGSILCFLPGQSEILRLARSLETKLPDTTLITPLYGAMQPAQQDIAIKPAPNGKRKIVLATSIAQTSITIDGVRTVIDSGLARVPVYEPNTGMTRLETQRAAKASIDQRAGRAGRTQEGVVYRIWHEGQTASLPDYERPEILEADLSSLVLDLAEWGVSDPKTLKWLDEPPNNSWIEAVKLLTSINALDAHGAINENGKKIRFMPLPPRLANMVLQSGRQKEHAALIALLLSERGLGGNAVDINHRIENTKRDKGPRAVKIKKLANSISNKINSANKPTKTQDDLSIGALLSFAYPDRIAKNMGKDPQGNSQFRMANGRRAMLDGAGPLAGVDYIVAAQIQGKASMARILSAAEINIDEIEMLQGERIKNIRKIQFDTQAKQFKARNIVSLDQLQLSSQPSKLTPKDKLADGLIATLREQGLGLIDINLDGKSDASNLRSRLAFLHSKDIANYPDVNDEALLAKLEEWLLPFIQNAKGFADIKQSHLVDGLTHLVGYEKMEQVKLLAPKRFDIPTGSKITLRYKNDAVILSVRVQELFGMKTHPNVMNGAVPITVELLSPAYRPIQTTMDLPRFWSGSWVDVKKEMKGRYPKHVWPDDPSNATPTARAKPRKK